MKAGYGTVAKKVDEKVMRIINENPEGVALQLGRKKLEKNQSTYIPLGSKHRLSNKGTEPLIIIEVQSGDYLGEDDIFRFEDVYGRK